MVDGTESQLFCKRAGYRTGERTPDPDANDDGGGQHDYAEILGGGEGRITEDRAQEAGGGAGGAECEIEALAGAAGNRHQPGQDRRDDEVDADENYVGGWNMGGEEDAGFRRSETVRGDPKKDEGMNEGDEGAFAIGEDREVHRMVKFPLPGGDWGVIGFTGVCD